MEGCCTISKKQSCLFPTLLRLSTKEVVAIWDVVSAYVLRQMKLDKGVLVPGLGTFAVVHEQINGTEEVYMVRRPMFQLDMDMSCLRELVFPTVMIPGDIKIMPLDYCWLSQTSSLPPDMVRGCVEETILLYSFQLSTRQRPAFTFENIGILSCQDNILCMQFHCSCIAGLASQDIWVALLLTVSAHCVRGFFHPTHKGCRETQGQNSVLPPCPDSSPKMKETGGQELAPSARPDITLLASENCQRALQEVWQLCAEWEHGNSHWREQKVEWAAWDAWAAAENQQVLQVFGAGGVWAPHRPSKPPRKGVTARWKKTGTPLPTEKMAERFQPGTRHLSPRAIQVLRGLEPHQMRRNIFMFLAENNRRRQEQQRQFCSSRCWSSA